MKVKAVAQISVPVIYEADIDEENFREYKKEYSYERRYKIQDEIHEPIWKIDKTKSREEVLKFLNEHLDDFTDEEWSSLLYPRYIEVYPDGVDYRNVNNYIFVYDD